MRLSIIDFVQQMSSESPYYDRLLDVQMNCNADKAQNHSVGDIATWKENLKK